MEKSDVNFAGNRLRTARKVLRITQKELAKKLELSPSLISNWENKKIKTAPSPEQLVQLANVLEVPVSAFFNLEKAPTLQAYRYALGKSIIDMSKKIGVPSIRILEFEKGEAFPVNEEVWAAAYGVNGEQLLEAWENSKKAHDD